MRLKHTRCCLLTVTTFAIAASPFGLRPAHAAAAGDKADAVLRLKEVIVTAEKRPENILTVPESVTLVSGATLQQQHATSLYDISANVPGLEINTEGTPGEDSITLRGIPPIGGADTVSTYIDGAPLGSSTFMANAPSYQLDIMPYDLKAVQVLRGPQGTLYGASAMGGLLEYQLQPPDSEKLYGEIGGDVTDVAHGRSAGGGARGMVNIPIIRGKLAMRVSAFWNSTPGFINDPVRRVRGDNAAREMGGRFAIRWTPTANLAIELEALRQQISADDFAVVALDPTGSRPLLGGLTSNFNLPEPQHNTVQFYLASVKWSLPWATLTSVSSYSDMHSVQTQDDSPAFRSFFQLLTGAAGYSGVTADIDVRKPTEELRIASRSAGRLKWMAGVFLTTERVVMQQLQTALGPDFQPSSLNPVFAAALPQRFSELAGFGHVDLRIVGGWHVSGGARYSYDFQHFEQIVSGSLASLPTTTGSEEDHVVTYSASSRYQFKHATVYGRIATGYQPGGPNVTLPGVPPTVGPSKLIDREVGVKLETFDERLRGSLSVFRMDWTRIQTTATTASGLGYELNGAGARSQGVEAEATLLAFRGLVLHLNAAYTHAYFAGPAPTLGLVGSGHALPEVPRISGGASARYTFLVPGAPGWVGDAGLTVRYEGSRSYDLFEAPAPPVVFIEKSYAALGLSLNVSHDQWTFGLFAKNLLDKRAYVTDSPMTDALSGSVLQVNAAVLQPRLIGFSVDRRF